MPSQNVSDVPSKRKFSVGKGAKRVEKLMSAESSLKQSPKNKNTNRKAARLQKKSRKLFQKYAP
jgi:hypothetical protein